MCKSFTALDKSIPILLFLMLWWVELFFKFPYWVVFRLRRAWQHPPVFLPIERHGWRSLAGYSLWGCKELDTNEWLSTAHWVAHCKCTEIQLNSECWFYILRLSWIHLLLLSTSLLYYHKLMSSANIKILLLPFKFGCEISLARLPLLC